MKKTVYPRLNETLFTQTLESGLPICVSVRPGFRKAYAFFAVNYGGMDCCFRQGGQVCRTPEGVAHFLEHKLFDMPEGNALQSLTSEGASVNAFTGSAMTAFHFECSEHFYTNLRTLLSFVTTPYFTAESVAKEQGIIAQEIRMISDRPGWRLYNNLLRSLYHNHPLPTSIAGTEASISRITPSVLHQCHSAFYHPNNMILCVVGDVDPQRVCATARLVSCSPKGSCAQRELGAEEPDKVVRERIADSMSIASPTFLTGFKAEPKPEDPLRQALVADLAGDLLCGRSSALYQRLYRDALIDRSFGISFESQPQAAYLVLGGDSSDPDCVARSVLEEGERMAREGIPEQDFQRILRSCYGSRIAALDSFEHTCIQLSQCHFQGSDYFSFPELYDQITSEEVRLFLEQTVRPEGMSTSILTPLGQA